MKALPDTPAGWERTIAMIVTAALTVLASQLTEKYAHRGLEKEALTERGFIALEAHRQTILYYEEKLTTCDCEGEPD